MKTLVFATQNKHKAAEINHVLSTMPEPDQKTAWKILSLADVQCYDEIPETSDTLEGNALQKALFVFNNYGYDCFADDTGLEVDALGGEPGIYSARYAGIGKDFDANIQKLLQELRGSKDRTARFRTVIALVLGSQHYFFEGIADGKIIEEKRGREGFGYDPVFVPDGFDKTFAEMSLDEKNKISHRAIAVRKLTEFLLTF